ncbi:chaperonin subunit delta [Naegleria gruberi]|uniref:T-complex protein 1 subunit delta n=1 Tax=Naegleria gruberi TaxID=5762 RepID=D2V5R0_NAEGR|nr:chaperonin subunit delta [Naegleria gruberi]EFC47840.1 chaperonin subunit delta [Naegleria gruberi]|eukprot:XP_002680584.1 chaperonin subunit delta [Naegleria gruberi strain NEG-M]
MSQTQGATPTQNFQRGKGETNVNEKERGKDVRYSNIEAAKALADSVRTSLGPKGMDKMIVLPKDEVIITNDGATILDKMKPTHPAAKMLVSLSKSQDIEAGDGTTTVVVMAGALLAACQNLLDRGIHPTTISDAFKLCVDKAEEILDNMSTKVDLTDRENMIKSAKTSLSSKVVYQYADVLAPLAVDAVLRVVESKDASNVDLNDIKIVKKLGGLLEETELIEGLVLDQGTRKSAGGPTSIKDAKIGLIQFQLSPPKTDMENNVVITDYTQIDRILREERAYLLNLCKQIKKEGCNVLLIQKSILRDATTDMSLHFLAKMGIMVIQDIDRKDVEFISKTLNCKPISSIDSFKKEKLGSAGLVEEVNTGDGRIVKITGIPSQGKTVTCLVRSSNKLMLDEAERSLHDALCVVRSLVKKKSIIAGGSAPETEISLGLVEYSKTLRGAIQYCVREYGESLEVIPTTLAENAGLSPIKIVTELKNRHMHGEKNAGINVKKGLISDMVEENVIQPTLTTLSAIALSTELVRMLLKIDDVVSN